MINNHIRFITVPVVCGICNKLISVFPFRFQSSRKADKCVTSSPSVTKSLLGQLGVLGQGEGREEAVWPSLLLSRAALGSKLTSYWESRVVGRCWAHKVALCAYGQCWSRTCTLTQIWAKLNFLPKWHTSTWLSKLAVWHTQRHISNKICKAHKSSVCSWYALFRCEKEFLYNGGGFLAEWVCLFYTGELITKSK